MTQGSDTPGSGPDFGSRTDFYTFAPETLAQELPEFEILREVGKGSMGVVYEARRRRDGLRVALKVLPPSPTLTERSLARFQREGEIMARVQHPAIVRVYEHGRQGRLHYFVMEFVDGMTLEERVAVGPLPARQAAELGVEIARALQFAHDRGVVHRDVKPGNLIQREDGRVAITDFGLARETGTGSLTESGAIVGTPMYMSPEQVLGDRGVVGTRADVYGLGATLYHLVTGRPPFSGPTAQSVLKAVLEHDPRPPQRLRTDLPAPLTAVLWKAMHKDPERRYATALELAEDLERFLRGERVLARLPGPLARLVHTVAQRPVAVALVLAVVLLGSFAFVAWREGRLRRLEASLAEAEWALEKASARYDESQARLPQMRKDYLAHAAAAATEVIEQDSTYARAWFVRSKAYHRQQRYRDALHDLDMAERRQGHATPEILHFRIDTLQHLDDRESRRRLREDLLQLLAIDEGLLTRCLVAEHLLALAERMPAAQRSEILATAEAVVDVTPASHPRLAITRAHVLELRGDLVGAEQAIRQASVDFASSPLVHARAASMLRRLGHDEEGEAQAYFARILDPDLADAASRAMRPEPAASFDWGEIDGFLGRLMGVLRGSGEPRR